MQPVETWSRWKAAHWRLLMLLALSAWLGCRAATAQETTPEPTPPPAVRYESFGWIDTEVRQIRPPDDQTLVVRGNLRNPYDQPIHGVRLIVRLLTAGDKPRELVRMQHELDIDIEPGRARPFDREFATSYAKVFRNASVTAFAMQRGTQELAAPPADVVTEAGNTKEVFYHSGDVPIVNLPAGVTPLFSLP